MAHQIKTNFLPQTNRPLLQNKMLEAIETGDLKSVQSLLNEGFSVNQLLSNKEFPLHAAVRSDQNSIEMVRLLIRSGANIDAKDSQNLTPLDRAIFLENIPLTKEILREKIGLSAKTVLGEAEHSCSSGYLSELKDRLGQTLSIDSTKLGQLQRNAYEGNLKELVKVNELDRLDKHGFAPIHYAILGGQQSVFQNLLKGGANPRLLTRSGDSILHLAAMKGSLPFIQLALDAGVQANFQNRRGESALHYAAVQEHLNSMKALIEKGANPSATNVQGASPLAVFTSKVRSRDPLSISTFLLPQAAFGILYLWELWQLKSTGSLVTSRWSPALSLAFFGLTITESIQATRNAGEEKNSLSLLLSGTEWIPGLGLGCSVWKTGHVVSSSLQMIKKGWDHLETRKWAGFQNIAIGSIQLASSIALLGNTMLLHTQWFQGSPQVPDYREGSGTPADPPTTRVDPGIRPQPSQPEPQTYTHPFTSSLPSLPKGEIPDISLDLALKGRDCAELPVQLEREDFPSWIHGPKFNPSLSKFERNPYALTNIGLCGAPSYKALASYDWVYITQNQSPEIPMLAGDNFEIESPLPLSSPRIPYNLPPRIEENPYGLTSLIPFERNKFINLIKRQHKFLGVERGTIAVGQEASEDQKLVAKPKQLNMNLFLANGMRLGGPPSLTPTPTPLSFQVLTPTPMSSNATLQLSQTLPFWNHFLNREPSKNLSLNRTTVILNSLGMTLETTLENTSNDGKPISPAIITGQDGNWMWETLKSSSSEIAFCAWEIYEIVNNLWEEIEFYSTAIVLPLLGLGIGTSLFFIPRRFRNEILHLENGGAQDEVSVLNTIPIVGALYAFYTRRTEDGKKVVNFAQRKLMERLPRQGYLGRLREWLNPGVAAPLLPLPKTVPPSTPQQQLSGPSSQQQLPQTSIKDSPLKRRPGSDRNCNVFGSDFIPPPVRFLGVLSPPAIPTTPIPGAGLSDDPPPPSS